MYIIRVENLQLHVLEIVKFNLTHVNLINVFIPVYKMTIFQVKNFKG